MADNQSWNEIIGEDLERPSARRGHTAVVYENSMFLFGIFWIHWIFLISLGGQGIDGVAYNDIYEFSFGITHIQYNIINDSIKDRMKWKKLNPVGSVPPPRHSHSAIVFKDSIYIFGGIMDNNKYADFFEFKISKQFLW